MPTYSTRGSGGRIKRTREQLHLTQQQIATACKVTKGAVSQWEKKGLVNMSLVTFFLLCDMLKVRPRWLALGIGPKSVLYPASTIGTASAVARLLDESPEQLDALFTVLVFGDR